MPFTLLLEQKPRLAQFRFQNHLSLYFKLASPFTAQPALPLLPLTVVCSRMSLFSVVLLLPLYTDCTMHHSNFRSQA